MTISKIVSGGQTGVDQGALQACQWIDFPYGGWVPKGRLTEAGPLPDTFDNATLVACLKGLFDRNSSTLSSTS